MKSWRANRCCRSARRAPNRKAAAIRAPTSRRRAAAVPKKTPPAEPPPRTALMTTVQDARSQLEGRIAKGRELLQQLADPDAMQRINDYEKWTSYNSQLLRKLFSTDEIS